MEDDEKEDAADDALESLKTLGPIGMIGIEYMRNVGVEFARTATNMGGVLVTDQTIFGGNRDQELQPQPSTPAHWHQWDQILPDLTMRRRGGSTLRGDPLSR